jgi:hypothetical protein
MSEKLVTIATFPNLTEAEISRARLEGAGIESFVADSEIFIDYPVSRDHMGGVRLSTKESDARKALEILNTNLSGN